ncbi:hypothetical protein HYD99_04015 [Mycoplasmopsis bovis]|nr:hypothetical protein [Mycoplasmopsis bovis]QQH29062.1 hypothetical protein HYD99_04015 [Mycoplasmopsis bovis]
MKQLSKKLLLQKSNTKRQGIKIKRWFKQEKRNCSAKGFEGEVTLKFEIETQSAKSKWEKP